MKKAEIIAVILSLVGIGMLLLHVVGGGIVLAVGILLLTLLYFPLSVTYFSSAQAEANLDTNTRTKASVKRLFGIIAIGFALGLTLVGSLMKLLLFEGGEIVLLSGIVLTAFMLVNALFYFFRNKLAKHSRILKRIVIVGMLGAVVYITPQAKVIDLHHADNPEYAELLKKHFDDPSDQEVKQQLQMMKRNLKNE